MSAERMALPTKAEIAALTDPAQVKSLIEAVEDVVTTIETRLSYSGINDDDWRSRAQGALIWHRNALKQLNRRAHELRWAAKLPTERTNNKGKVKSKPENARPDAENDALTNEVLSERRIIDAGAITSTDEINNLLAWIVPRMAAVEADRNDEIAMPAHRRDEGFLAATGSALKALRGYRSALEIRRGVLGRPAKSARIEAKLARQERRELMFIDAARDLLPGETFQALWDRVDRQEVEAAGTELAA